jgi:hypothetical protein
MMVIHMKNNMISLTIAVIIIMMTALVSAISFSTASAGLPGLNQMNECSTQIEVDDNSTSEGGQASGGGAASAANNDRISTSAAAAPGTGTLCENNVNTN